MQRQLHLDPALLTFSIAVAPIDGRSERAALAACAARRWLASNAAGVKVIRTHDDTDEAASAWIGLVACLPALERATLRLDGGLAAEKLTCLLEALAWCPRLEELVLYVCLTKGEGDIGTQLSPEVPSFAVLRSLTSLTLAFWGEAPPNLVDVVDALVSLVGLAVLVIGFDPSPAVLVPAALARLQGLRSLMLCNFHPCNLEVGCLNLPNLVSLDFHSCHFEDTQVLLGITALQRLSSIMFSDGEGPRFFDPQLVQLSQLQRMTFRTSSPSCGGAFRGPADLGSLSSSLVHLDFSGHGLTLFPLALTQLVALEYLNASSNEFAELPAGIMALSRLTELTLGRITPNGDQLQVHAKRPLDVRALGDLSSFPALCMLSFEYCEVLMCDSMLGAARHASLTSITFDIAHPAPECALMVLQLLKELKKLKRGSMVRFWNLDGWSSYVDRSLQDAQGQAPFLHDSTEGVWAVRCWVAGTRPGGVRVGGVRFACVLRLSCAVRARSPFRVKCTDCPARIRSA